jgi:hypothetical protein
MMSHRAFKDTNMTKTVVALFNSFPEAQRAVADLKSAGIRDHDVSLVAHDHDERWGREHGLKRVGDTKADEGAGTGATIGAALGGGAGLLAGLGILAIPGIGPIVAAGALVAALTGAGAGAAAGGLVGALAGSGIPDDDAHVYAEGVRRGGALLTVTTDDGTSARVEAILAQHQPVNIDERREEWKKAGWSRFDESAQPFVDHSVATAAAGNRKVGTDPLRVRTYAAAAGNKPGVI